MEVHLIEGMGFAGNIYIIDAERPIMIDTGWDSNLDFISDKIDNVLNGRKLEKIVLTHRHVDHVGGALAIQKKYGGTLHAQPSEAKALRSADQTSTGATMFGTRLEPMDVADLEEGRKIELDQNHYLEVMTTPGHTEGSICLISSTGSVFSGDTVFTHGGVGRWDFPTGNYDQLLDSIEKLASLEVKTLFPGHGPFEKDGNFHINLSLNYLREAGRYG